MVSQPTDLVVGVDGSDATLGAVRWAAEMARERRRGLRLVHGTDELPVAYPHATGTVDEFYEAVGAQGQRLLAQAREAAMEVARLEPQLVQRPERPQQALIAESHNAAMVILGTPQQGRVGKVLLGSTSLAVAAHAECPVALVRPHVADDDPPTEGPVVVGVDGTPVGDDALAAAFEEASWRGAPLVAVHCWHQDFLSSVSDALRWTQDTAAIEQHEHEVLAQRLAGWQEKYPDVSVERVVLPGRPAERLLELADRARLMVVGSRGRGGLAGLALGSTSQAMMSYALCPVLVVRGRARSEEK